MKSKILSIVLVAVILIFSITACGKKEESSFDNSKVAKELGNSESKKDDTQKASKPENDNTEGQDGDTEGKDGEIEGQDGDTAKITFKDFAGIYYFSSGVGGWSTEVTISPDGTFTGVYNDSEMGSTGEDYPHGTVYLCEFSGKFSELAKKDDYTYTCSLVEITQKEEKGKEEINKEDGVKYIYSYPYGFDDGKDFEFYLQGKSVGDCDPEFLSWMSLRYNDPVPATLFSKAFVNLSGMYGFEESVDYSYNEEVNYPESLPLETGELTGLYTNKNLGIGFGIVYMGSVDGTGDIYWDISEDANIHNDDGIFAPSDNGFDVKTPIFNDEYVTSYKIIVTDNTREKVVIHLYDDRGRDCGEYVMTEHWTAYKDIQKGPLLLGTLFNSSSAMTIHYGSYPWRVIGYDGYGVAGEYSTMTLISEGIISPSQFEVHGVSNEYAHSTLQTNVDAIADWFSTIEKNAVTKRTLLSGEYNADQPNETDCIAGSQVESVLLWPLSTKEANALDIELRKTDVENESSSTAIWWLRSPSFHDDVAAVVYGGGDIMPDGHKVDSKYGVRPAFYLKLSSVFLASAAEGGKYTAFQKPRGTWTKEWKLTLKDGSTGFDAKLPSEGTSGKNIKVNVSAMPTGDTAYNQISALLVDSNDTVIAYGKIGEATTGEKNFTIPEDIPEGIYTLSVFPEQVNGDYETDYVGNIIENTIIID